MKNFTLFMALAATTLVASASEPVFEFTSAGGASGMQNSYLFQNNQISHVFNTVPSGTQRILTKASGSAHVQDGVTTTSYIEFPNWKVSCLVTPADMVGSIDSRGTDKTFPLYSNIIGLYLQGGNYKGASQNVYTTSYVSYTDATDITENPWIAYPSYTDMGTQVSDRSEYTVENSTSTNIFASDFNKPFIYNGNNVLLNFFLENTVDMNFTVGTIAAAAKNATVYRGNGYIYTKAVSESSTDSTYVSPVNPIFAGTHVYNLENTPIAGYDDNYLGLTENTLPAFSLKYKTHRIKLNVTTNSWVAAGASDPIPYTTVTLYDSNNNVVKVISTEDDDVRSDYYFDELNPEETYTITISTDATVNEDGSHSKDGKTYDGTGSYGSVKITNISFKGENSETATPSEYKNEVVLNVRLFNTVTAVDDVNTAKEVTSVKYYNVAGVESAEPFNGVNVVVKTFADGSKTVTKQINK